MPSVDVFLWRDEDVEHIHLYRAQKVINNTMSPQFDNVDLYAYDMYSSHGMIEPFRGDSSYSSPYTLLDDFGEFVMDNYYTGNITPSEDDIHVLITEGPISGEIPAGLTSGSVGDGVGAEELDGDVGVVSMVNIESYKWGWVYADDLGSFKNTVMHEVYHALTHEDYVTYNPPSQHCRPPDAASSPDHSLGKVYDDGWGDIEEVSPMATWYTPEAKFTNTQPCRRCDGSPDRNADAVSHSFTECAIEEADEYVFFNL